MASSHTITVTCQADGRPHEVTDEAMAAGAARRTGRYRALCGHEVTAAPMVAPIGRPCGRCAAERATDQPPRRHRRGVQRGHRRRARHSAA